MRTLTALFLMAFLFTACAVQTAMPPSATLTPLVSTATPELSLASTQLAPTVAPTATAEVVAGGEILAPLDVSKVPAEVIAARNSVTLKDDDAMRWTYSDEYKMFGKIDGEGKLTYLIYPMTYAVDGKETKVLMPMRVSCTSGKGAMCAMSGIAKGEGEHGAIEITGTDAKAREWVKWVSENETWKKQNPFLIDSLKKVASGELDIEFVFADMNLLPASVQAERVPGDAAGEPKLFGKSVRYMRMSSGELMDMYPDPFIRDGKLVIFVLRNVSVFVNHESSNPLSWDRVLAMSLMEASFFHTGTVLDGQKGADLQTVTAQELASRLDVNTIPIE